MVSIPPASSGAGLHATQKQAEPSSRKLAAPDGQAARGSPAAEPGERPSESRYVWRSAVPLQHLWPQARWPQHNEAGAPCPRCAFIPLPAGPVRPIQMRCFPGGVCFPRAPLQQSGEQMGGLLRRFLEERPLLTPAMRLRSWGFPGDGTDSWNPSRLPLLLSAPRPAGGLLLAFVSFRKQGSKLVMQSSQRQTCEKTA